MNGQPLAAGRRALLGRSGSVNVVPYRIAFLIVTLLLWLLFSKVFFPRIIPGIGDTLSLVGHLLTGHEFYVNLWATARRVFLGFAIAFVVGMAIGIAMGRSKRAEAFFEIWVVVGLSQPGLFVAMIMLVALGLRDSTAIITLGYLASPLVTTSVWQGAKGLDRDLDMVASVFGYGRLARLRHVILPQLVGPALSGARSGMGITWKYVLVVEMIGMTSGVGYQVNRAFQLMALDEVVAWTICFMLVIMLVEYGVLRTLERYAFAWRDRPSGSAAKARRTRLHTEALEARNVAA